MDSELKRQFTQVLEEIGLDAPTAVRMLAIQTVKSGQVPLSLSVNYGENDTLSFLDNVRADWGQQ
jgi:addiction module RelB/DinJ family antitoxin